MWPRCDPIIFYCTYHFLLIWCLFVSCDVTWLWESGQPQPQEYIRSMGQRGIPHFSLSCAQVCYLPNTFLYYLIWLLSVLCSAHSFHSTQVPAPGPIYSLSELELSTLREFIDSHLKSQFIYPSSSSHSAPVLFTCKKDSDMTCDSQGSQKPLCSTLVDISIDISGQYAWYYSLRAL